MQYISKSPDDANNGLEPELGLVPICQLPTCPIADITPARINDSIYRPVDRDDPAVREMAQSIARLGLLAPLVLTLDNVILSGHRRYAACQLAGLTHVPYLRSPIHSTAANFPTLLVEHNRQRTKTTSERLREEVVVADSKAAYASLRAYRQQTAKVDLSDVGEVDLRGVKTRAKISDAKTAFLCATRQVLLDLNDFLPLSARQIHYALLNNPPRTHQSKPTSVYANTPACYKQLTDLLTRARVERLIPMDAIADETRGVTIWDVHAEAGQFVSRELRTFLRAYHRDLLQSQPNHIELVGEKNTLKGIVEPIAAEFCLPYTTLRGFCSTPPKAAMAKRFRASGKERFILLALTDFDPEGEEIAHSLARDLRDEHGVTNIDAVKVCLTQEQVVRLGLPPNTEAKETSANYRKFYERYGSSVYELEAIPAPSLQSILRDAIQGVLDVQAFNAELKQEEADAAELAVKRTRILQILRDEGFGDFGLEGSEQ